MSRQPYRASQPRIKKQPYKYKSGAVYEGEWRGGFRDGFGMQQWPDGAMYEGEWRDGKAHG